MRRLLFFVAVVAALGASATLTYAAGRQLAATPPSTPAKASKLATVVVPDLRGEAFVFAKQQLQDSGFAWRVVGGVDGYAANTVVAQSPAAGTTLVDTGAPLVKVTLTRNGRYRPSGEPQNTSPYGPTAARQAR
ncbi:MAG TPA: PASTA domain-containing protein [Gaiellaceae bacterium]|nr:PASTA domain-containing protein [Gaiellaceae bacterium]